MSGPEHALCCRVVGITKGIDSSSVAVDTTRSLSDLATTNPLQTGHLPRGLMILSAACYRDGQLRVCWIATMRLCQYLRDRTAHDGRYRPVRDLKELRSLTRTTLYDIDACSQEIVEFSQSDSRYRYDVLEMSYVREVRGGKPDLLSDLSASQNRRALQIQREAAVLRSTLSTSNDLSQTISNIFIQRLVLLLTLVSIGIALWAVFLTLRTVP